MFILYITLHDPFLSPKENAVAPFRQFSYRDLFRAITLNLQVLYMNYLYRC